MCSIVGFFNLLEISTWSWIFSWQKGGHVWRNCGGGWEVSVFKCFELNFWRDTCVTGGKLGREVFVVQRGHEEWILDVFWGSGWYKLKPLHQENPRRLFITKSHTGITMHKKRAGSILSKLNILPAETLHFKLFWGDGNSTKHEQVNVATCRNLFSRVN